MPISGGRFFSVVRNPSASDVLSVGEIGWTPASRTIRIGNPGESLFIPGTINGRADADFIISPGANGRTLKLGDSSLGNGTVMTCFLNGGNTLTESTGNLTNVLNRFQSEFYSTPGRSFALSGSESKRIMRVYANYSGSSSFASHFMTHFKINADTTARAGVSGGFGVLGVTHAIGGTGTTGGRIPFLVEISQIGASTGGGDFSTAAFWQTLKYSMGGTSPDYAGGAGRAYGTYKQILLEPGAVNLLGVHPGGEVDLRIKTGASVAEAIGHMIVLLKDHAVAATELNIGYLLGGQTNIVPTWQLGYGIGSPSGEWPMAADSTLYGITMQMTHGGDNRIGVLPHPRAARGMDLRKVTFSDAFLHGPGFSVDHEGRAAVANSVIEATASGVAIDVKNQIVTGISIQTAGQTTGNGIGNYYPGDKVFGPSEGRYSVSTTKVTAALIVNAGSGGTNGTQTVTGTTGTGTKFQLTVTVSGGAIASIDAVSVQGSYTVAPTDVFDEPVTGGGLSGASVSVSMGIATLSIDVPDVAPNGASTYANPVTLTDGSGSGATANLTWGANDLLHLNPTGKAVVFTPPPSAPALASNGELILEFTSNTTVTVRGRGTDGTTRSGTITLS